MNKVVVLVVLGIVLSLGVLGATVDSEIESLLDSQEEISVIVVLEDDHSAIQEYRGLRGTAQGADSIDMKKKMIGEQQERLKEWLQEENAHALNALLDEKAGSSPNAEERTVEITSEFTLVNGVAATVDAKGLEHLMNAPNVKHVYPNRRVQAFLSDVKTVMNATKTWQLIYNSSNLTGNGQTVCVIDTGVDYTHASMGGCSPTSNINDRSCGKVIGGYDFASTPDDENPIDDEGHGTHVAGIVASTDQTYRGIAPDAKIVAIKALDEDGGGFSDDIVDGISWCTNNASVLNITVISMSLGSSVNFASYCDDYDPAMTSAINLAVGRNISVVVATGNSGNVSGISNPACVRNATAIGSTTKADVVSGFTNSNAVMDLLATGSSITSLRANGADTTGCSVVDANFMTCSGTSMATPAAAGAFALLNQYFMLKGNSSRMPHALEGIFNATGKRVTDGGNGITFSRINLFAAIRSQDNTPLNISFVSPTPANNTQSGNPYAFISITSSRTLLTSLLDFNNTNVSMNGGGVGWNYNRTGLSDGIYIYKVWGNDSFGNMGVSEERIYIKNNNLPNITSLNITSTDSLNRKNGTLGIAYSVFDADGDSATVNLTRWYRNGVEVLTARNTTTIHPNNLTKNDAWNVSVMVHDGTNFSIFVNSSNFLIANANPSINTSVVQSSYSVLETQLINISLNATDIDLDALTFRSNLSSLSIANNNLSAYWYTALTDSGVFYVNLSVNDSTAIDSMIITLTILDARDLDGDGNPDFNETDDDNDGILDEGDHVAGNLSLANISASLGINITINGTSNLSKRFNSTTPIAITSNLSNTTLPIIEFNVTLNASNTLDLGNITINYTRTGSSAISIRGIGATTSAKTIYLDKVNSTVKAVCVKDADASFESISSYCNGASETLVACTNTTTGQYACYDTGSRYQITGLSHSAIKESCQDADGDGYGSGCSLGTDCNDGAFSSTNTCSSGDSGGGGSGGGGGGGGSGGGGGGGSLPTGIRASKFFTTIEPNVPVTYALNKKGMPITLVEFIPTVKNAGVTLSIKVVNKNETPVHTGFVYQFVDISVDILKEEQINSASIRFEVNESWLEENDLDGESVTLERYDNGWQELETAYLGENGTTLVYTAQSPGFSFFAITAYRKESMAMENNVTTTFINETETTEMPIETPVFSNESVKDSRIYWIEAALVLLALITLFFFLIKPKEPHPEMNSFKRMLHRTHHMVHHAVRRKI